MYQCKDVSDEVNNYIDGDLSLRKRIGLFFHLMVCSCCRNYLQQVRSTISIVTVARPKEQSGTDINELSKKLHSLCHEKDHKHH